MLQPCMIVHYESGSVEQTVQTPLCAIVDVEMEIYVELSITEYIYQMRFSCSFFISSLLFAIKILKTV